MLLAVTCAGCGNRGAPLCPRCADGLVPAPALPPPPGVDACWSLFAYTGPARHLLVAIKYRNHRGVLPGLAAAAAALVDRPVDVVTWVPTTTARRRVRGFDQSELLARRVAAELGRPCRRLLARDPGPPQTGRPAAHRRRPTGFRPRRPCGGSILLVDDVVTTGSSLTTAASALRRAGAGTICALTVARTPLKVTTERDEA